MGLPRIESLDKLEIGVTQNWATQWRIKINPEKSLRVVFTLRKRNLHHWNCKEWAIPTTTEVKYIGLTLDQRLTSVLHLIDKRKTVNNRLHMLRPIYESKLSFHAKSILYKSLLRPIWAYGIQIWGCVKPSQTPTIQSFQLMSLRLMASAPWYTSNKALHKDLKID